LLDRREGLASCAAKLVVVVRACGLRTVRGRIAIQQRLTDRIQPACRNFAEHAAVTEACGLVGCAAGTRQLWILDEVEERAVLVERLGEVSRAFQSRRHTKTDRVAVVDRLIRGAILVAIEEEQLVVPTRLADRAAD
jgi:hypothetical protein